MKFEQYQKEVLDAASEQPRFEYRLSSPWLFNNDPAVGVWSLGEMHEMKIVKIPNWVLDRNGRMLPVDTLRAGLFANQTAITDVAIPSNVKNIGQGVFQNCSHLQRVALPRNAFVPKESFAGCSQLEEIYYEGDQNEFVRKVLRLYESIQEGYERPDRKGEWRKVRTFSIWNPELLGIPIHFNCKLHDQSV